MFAYLSLWFLAAVLVAMVPGMLFIAYRQFRDGEHFPSLFPMGGAMAAGYIILTFSDAFAAVML